MITDSYGTKSLENKPITYQYIFYANKQKSQEKTHRPIFLITRPFLFKKFNTQRATLNKVSVCIPSFTYRNRAVITAPAQGSRQLRININNLPPLYLNPPPNPVTKSQITADKGSLWPDFYEKTTAVTATRGWHNHSVLVQQ